jgi:ABC-type nitrate/sulfonate/bicarbonate transport system substrate-binding protein
MKRGEVMLLGALAAVARATPAVAAEQKIAITVPTTEPDNGAYFVAARKGYFAAEGLDVELVFASGGTATPGLLAGSVDGSASSASALTAILRGAALRIVLVFNDTPTYKLWATNDIRTLADLKGKSVGVASRGDTLEIATRLALQAAGIPPDSVGYTPLGFASTIPAAFQSGALPAVVLSTGRAVAMTEAGQLKGAHVLVDFFGNVHMPYNGFVMTEKLLYGDPVLAKKMVRAIVKGARYAKAFKHQTVAIVGSYQKVTEVRASEVEYDEFTRAVSRDFTVSNELIAGDLAVRAGLIGLPKDQIPPIDKVYDFSIVRAVNAELDASHWRPTA